METVWTIEWKDGTRRATVDAGLARAATVRLGSDIASVTAERRPKPAKKRGTR